MFGKPTSRIQREPFNWQVPEFNELSEAIAREGDVEKRREMHRRILEIVDNEDPFGTVLFFNALFYGKRKDVPWAPYPTLYADYGPTNPATAK